MNILPIQEHFYRFCVLKKERNKETLKGKIVCRLFSYCLGVCVHGRIWKLRSFHKHTALKYFSQVWPHSHCAFMWVNVSVWALASAGEIYSTKQARETDKEQKGGGEGWRIESCLTFMKLIFSALSNKTWTELSIFLASWRRSLSCRTCLEFSWQNFDRDFSSTFRAFPRSSSRSCCIFWYFRRTSCFSWSILSCTQRTQTAVYSTVQIHLYLQTFMLALKKLVVNIHSTFTLLGTPVHNAHLCSRPII